MSGIYRDSAKRYVELGFRPIPVTGKFPPVKGATGNDGTVTPEKIKKWRTTHATENVALRMEGTIGIDVDAYDGKRGDVTLRRLVEALGPLPRTWTSTARGRKTPSRQHLFRAPEGQRFKTKLAVGDSGDIEVIQFFHRYTVCYPSIHPATGKTYRWYSPDGTPSNDPPHIDELPELPEAWFDFLAEDTTKALDPDAKIAGDWQELVATFASADKIGACSATEAYRAEIEAVQAASHISHDDAVRLAHRGFMLGREGHRGVGDALDSLAGYFATYLGKARPKTADFELDSVFNAEAETAQRKPVEKACYCDHGGDDLILTLEPAEEKAIEKKEKKREVEKAKATKEVEAAERKAAKEALQKHRRENGAGLVNEKNGTLLIDVARDSFYSDHPVKRYKDSTGIAYVWLDGRWQVTDLKILTYRWLAVRLKGDLMNKRKGEELYTAAIAFADIVSDADIDDRFISVANGLLDWQTGGLRERTPDLFVVTHLPVKWNPKAKPGRFDEWMDTAVEDEMRKHVWEILGYAIAPVHDLKVALAFSGAGGGGKSTLINVIESLVGEENSSHIAPQSLGDRFNRAQIHGKLLNAVGDVGAETIRNVGALKSIIAGDTLSAEYKGRDGFSFRPNAFIVASFNTLPATESNDSGFWDRWLVLSFKQRFASDTSGGDNYWRDVMPFDPDILEGVLVRAVRALRRLRKRGAFDKRAFLPAKNEWRQEVDSVAAFAEERLVVVNDGVVKAKAVHDLYSSFELSNHGKPRKNRTFYRELLAYLDERHPGRVFIDKRGANVLSLVGVKVLLDGEEPSFSLASPEMTYGPAGWTNNHLRAV